MICCYVRNKTLSPSSGDSQALLPTTPTPQQRMAGWGAGTHWNRKFKDPPPPPPPGPDPPPPPIRPKSFLSSAFGATVLCVLWAIFHKTIFRCAKLSDFSLSTPLPPTSPTPHLPLLRSNVSLGWGGLCGLHPGWSGMALKAPKCDPYTLCLCNALPGLPRGLRQ